MFPIKNNKIDKRKFFDDFSIRLTREEGKKNKRKKRPETDAEIEHRFAKLREARAKERAGPVWTGNNEYTYGDVWDEVTDEEIDYYKKKALQVPPEKRYQAAKKHPTSHPSSWTSRGIKTGYDGKGCNQFTGCVPECRFYPETGRIEDDEVIAKYEKWKRDRDSTTRD
jgi:hypothetical protein